MAVFIKYSKRYINGGDFLILDYFFYRYLVAGDDT